ncbi:Clp1/GlmU family protein [Hydrogenimonas urashimensis]|uniref:Clp1/GlmU family protein n=1 Tax=Hydrogenimonas urashimensis TaxID=2740515 RepID=UPI001916279A|nr:Clp1/GlmU family protein [Hydrogenimonas urashimensis]
MANETTTLDTPSAWLRLDEKLLSGIVMVIGGTDSGKSTFVRHFAERLRGERLVAVIDGDIGQTALGPPTTQTLSLCSPDFDFVCVARWFVGGISPAGHREQTLVGLERLVQKAKKSGARTILIDTTGFISPDAGGHTLKWSKFDLLRPATLIALKKGEELEPILSPWRKSGRFSMIELPLSNKVQKISPARRKRIRQDNFRRYFQDATTISVSLETTGVVGRWPLRKMQLVGLIDNEGFLLRLGIVERVEDEKIFVKAPLFDPKALDMVRTGSLLLDEKAGWIEQTIR